MTKRLFVVSAIQLPSALYNESLNFVCWFVCFDTLLDVSKHVPDNLE